jgi:hypothetical protein
MTGLPSGDVEVDWGFGLPSGGDFTRTLKLHVSLILKRITVDLLKRIIELTLF